LLAVVSVKHVFCHCEMFFKQIGHLGELPKEVPPEAEKNEDFLRKAHHVLLEVNFTVIYHLLFADILWYNNKQDFSSHIIVNFEASQ